MGFSLEGWTGDNAGEIVGRKPNTLLITLTTDGSYFVDWPEGLYQKGEALGGVPWYYNIGVACLTPGARSAIAAHVEFIKDADAYAIEVAEIEWGGEEELKPWEPGVHLFAVEMWAFQGPASATTLATAVIHPSLRRVNLTEGGQAVSALLSQAERIRRRGRPTTTATPHQ